MIEGGTKAVTARAVADKAGVTPGLIRHHFGSMEGLLAACDEYVVDGIRQRKEEGFRQGAAFDLRAALGRTEDGRMMGYVARRITDKSPAIDALIDHVIDDSLEYLKVGEETGMVVPTDDERGRATILTLLTFGSLSMHRHITRYFGVDLTADNVTAQPGYRRYAVALLDALGAVIEPSLLKSYRDALKEM